MLEGDLREFGLADVLRLLSFTSKTGRLTLRGGGVTGRLDLVDGRVRDVSADTSRVHLARRLLGLGLVEPVQLERLLRARDGLPTGTELLSGLVHTGHLDAPAAAAVLREEVVDQTFELTRVPEGTFRFDPAREGAPESAGTAELGQGLTVDELLADVGARLDEWPAIEDRTGSGSAVVTIRRPEGGAEPTIDADGWALLALVDGRRTVDELVELDGRGGYATRATLRGLIEQGVVTVSATADDAPVMRLLAAHRALGELEGERGGASAPEPPEVIAEDAGGRGAEGAAPPVREAAAQPDVPVAGGWGPAGRAVPPPPPFVVERTRPVPPAPSGSPQVTLDAPEAGPERLRPDPAVDIELLDRLIAGVEEL